jgi:hypothetical protein
VTGKPFIKHKADGEHDFVKAKCRPHVCKPMAASTVRQIHAILSGVLWRQCGGTGWNPVPRGWLSGRSKKLPESDPPSPAELVDEVFRMDEDWALSCGCS